MAVHMKKCLAG